MKKSNNACFLFVTQDIQPRQAALFAANSGSAQGVDDVLAWLSTDLDLKKSELDPRVQALLLESTDTVSQAITSALCALVEIYCRVSLHAQGLRSLKVVQAQKEFAHAAEKKFVAAVAALRTEHKYAWDAIEGLQMHLKMEQRGIYLEWVQYSRLTLEGLAPHKGSHEVFFLAICELAGALPQENSSASSQGTSPAQNFVRGEESPREPSAKKAKILQEHPSDPDEVLAAEYVLDGFHYISLAHWPLIALMILCWFH